MCGALTKRAAAWVFRGILVARLIHLHEPAFLEKDEPVLMIKSRGIHKMLGRLG